MGYPQERAFAMSADRDCELGDKISAGRLLLHTCRSTFGYSGGPILVSTGGREMEVAGIQIAAMKSDGTEKMLAVPAQAIGRQDREEIIATLPAVEASAAGPATLAMRLERRKPSRPLETIRVRLDLDRPDVVTAIPVQPADAGRGSWHGSGPSRSPPP